MPVLGGEHEGGPAIVIADVHFHLVRTQEQLYHITVAIVRRQVQPALTMLGSETKSTDLSLTSNMADGINVSVGRSVREYGVSAMIFVGRNILA